MEILGADPVVADKIKQEIERTLISSPPTIAIIGLSGVGKSSTLNSLFGDYFPVSHTIRGTTKFERFAPDLDLRGEYSVAKTGKLIVYDAPGLGESIETDVEYVRMYNEVLPQCDAAIWIMTATNRALALDQKYLRDLTEHSARFVFALNKCDECAPMNWDRRHNIPSSEQSENLEEIRKHRQDCLSQSLGRDITIHYYSARRHYRTLDVFKSAWEKFDTSRRWMLEAFRETSTEKWLDGRRTVKQDMADLLRNRLFY
jgi:uncharacterized protein